MAKEIKPEQLLTDLAQFTGTTQWYKNPLFPDFTYTDGVKYLAENAECYWLIDYVLSNQTLPEIRKEEFQTWNIFVTNNQAEIKVDDGNKNIVEEFKIPFTDFPLEKFTLWFVGGVLLLPSEY